MEQMELFCMNLSVVRTSFSSKTLALTLLFLSALANAAEYIGGDVFPRSAQDNQLLPQDIILIEQFISGEIEPTELERRLVDTYPLGAGDGVIDNNDLDLINQALVGNIALPTVNTGPAPTLNHPGFSNTTLNPLPLTGTAPANSTVNVYVNNVLQGVTQVPSDGSYSVNVPLVDENNRIFVIATSGSIVSDYSNSLDISYQNTASRTLSGSLSGTVVLTPGIPAQPYLVTGSDLVVPTTAKLIIQPGTEIKFAAARKIVANGTLSVRGSASSKVRFVSSNATPSRGAWGGIVINSTSINSKIENAFIESSVQGVLVSGAAVLLKKNVINYFSGDGIKLTGSGASASIIEGNIIDNLNDTVQCLTIDASSPTVIENTLTNCAKGISIVGNSSPSITSNNVITSNVNGISFTSPTLTTNPVITGNQIFSNTTSNITATGFPSGAQNIRINATNNWWGSVTPNVIAGTISDLSDSTSLTTRPTVDYANYLDAVGGSPVPGNYLLGQFTATTTTLTAGGIYDVLGLISVPSGKTLIIPAGTTLRFHTVNNLTVDGTLLVQGTSSNKVILTSARATPARGDWNTIWIRGGAGSIIENANIEYATYGIFIENTSAQIKNNHIRYFSSDGIYVKTASASASIIEGNIVDNVNNTLDCLTIDASSPTIIGNTLTNCAKGISIVGNSSPSITGNNVITSNVNGISFTSSTLTTNPVITGNQIFSNTTSNITATGFPSGAQNIRINATNNWWGSTTPNVIAETISDLSDSASLTTRPTVDYANYLDAVGGSPVSGNYLLGQFTATTTLTAGGTYDVLGLVTVPSGKTLIIPAGTTLRFHTVNNLTVDGTLLVQGTSSNKVTLTSARATPARGDWGTIWVKGGTGSIIENANIEYATYGIFIENTSAQIKNNYIRYFSSDGIHVKTASASASIIEGNVIDNLNNTLDCLTVSNSSPTIIGNTLTNCNIGLSVVNNSSPLVNGNNIISGNKYGIKFTTATLTTLPVINGNQILANTTDNVDVRGYPTGGNKLKLNAKGNWWGTTNFTSIMGSIYDLNNDSDSTVLPTVDFSNPLDGPNGTAIAGTFFNGLINTDTTFISGETYLIIGSTFVSANKTLTIPAGTTLKFYGESHLVVDGTLNIQGTTNDPVLLTSGRAVKNRGDWKGIWIRNGSVGSTIQNAIIEYNESGILLDTAAALISGNTIRQFENDGIYLQGAGATASFIEDNIIDNLNDTGYCVVTDTSSPTIRGNKLINCETGLYVVNSSSPVVNANNIISSNNNGIKFSTAKLTTLPVINGNQIFANITNNVDVRNYPTGGNKLKLNAKGNWWGTTNLTTIMGLIYDLNNDSDSAVLPTVDFGNPLDGPNGSAIPGNFLNGIINADTTFISGETYLIIGSTFVAANKTLTIPAGTTLKFYGKSDLVVDGTLLVQGTVNSPVVLTSGRATQNKDDWRDIWIRSSSVGSVIQNAIIEYNYRGILLANAAASINGNTIRQFENDGIYLQSAGATTSVVENNIIDNLDDTGYCITVDTSSPTIRGNKLTNCGTGLYVVKNSSPVVNGNNIISGNNYGIKFSAATLTTLPVINSNQIFTNTTYNLDATGYPTGSNELTINATGNWWGTTDVALLANEIYDLNDSPAATNLPLVNINGLLAVDGTIAAGNYLAGQLPDTILVSNTTYNIVGSVTVPTGNTLTIQPGAILKFLSGTKLTINGSLNVLGESSQPVIFTSVEVSPAVSDWNGILINTGATNVSLSNVIVQYASNGIYIDKTSSVVNITDSLIQLCDIGIYINGTTNPVLSNNRIVGNAKYGVHINGNNNDLTDPKPVLNNNDIYSNTTRNINVANYTAAPTVKMDVTNNWWGTATPTFTGNMLNYSPVLTSASLAPTIKSHSLTNTYFSPNSDTVQDNVILTSLLSETAEWTVSVQNLNNGELVRNYNGSDLNALMSWDGLDVNGQLLPDGRYGLRVHTIAGSRSGISLYREFVLDTIAPTLQLDPLLALIPQRNVNKVLINGSANDQNFLNYSVAYTNNLLPVLWNNLASNIVNNVNDSLLASWVVGNTVGAPSIANGQYTVRLTVQDLAGNRSIVTSPVTIDNLSIANVSVQNVVNLRNDVSGTINFNMNVPGVVTVNIYSITGGITSTPVKTLTIDGISGVNSVNWDGRDQLGNKVTDVGYLFVITGSDGTRYGRYDESAVSISTQATFTSINTQCDAKRNIFASFSVTAPQPGTAGIQLSTPNGTIYPFGVNGKPVPEGTTIMYWDCRDPVTGALATFPASQTAAFFRFPPNTILVEGYDTLPKISGSGSNVEVKTDPYLIYLSYGQFTKIRYALELFEVSSAQVDIKLLPPGILNIDDASAINVFSGIQPAGEHEVTWSGVLSGPDSAQRITGSTEGAYTFAIKVTSNGVSSLYRGTLSVYQ